MYEIERKFLVRNLPKDLDSYPHKEFEQGYLCTSPVVRARREGEEYVLTYKSRGILKRREENLPLNKEAYEHLIAKADGIIIQKTRYVIPERDGLQIELDIFHGVHEGLILAEVEFPSEEAAKSYEPAEWLGEDVTFSPFYHNSVLSRWKTGES